MEMLETPDFEQVHRPDEVTVKVYIRLGSYYEEITAARCFRKSLLCNILR